MFKFYFAIQATDKLTLCINSLSAINAYESIMIHHLL